MNKDSIQIKGNLKIYNANSGELLYEKDNLVTNQGLAFYIDRLVSDSSKINYIGIDDSSTTYDETSLALTNEILRKQLYSVSSPDNSAIYTFFIDSNEAVGAWNALGLFDSASGGTMTNVINVNYTHNAGDSLKIEWKITFN